MRQTTNASKRPCSKRLWTVGVTRDELADCAFKRSIRYIVPFLVTLVCTLLVWNYRSNQREVREIRQRYEQMRLAFSSGDTNAASALIAPDFRTKDNRSFDMLRNFALPLGERSSIRFSNSRAVVCPERNFHLYVIPGGHTIEMVKVKGEWYFTGKVHID